MFITTASMTVVVGMAAMGIDVAQWYQKHHQAQVAADAAALAAANCMANVGITNAASTSSCTTTSDAAAVATAYAAANGVSIPTGDVSFANDSVTVTTPDPAGSLFASAFGINATPTARSSATWTAPITSGCTAGQESSGACYFAFARDANCPDVGITLENNGNVQIKGGIWSDSSLSTVNADNNSAWGNVTYGNGPLCTWLGASAKGSGPSFTAGPSPHSPLTAWPRDYSTLMACGSGSQYAYTCGPSGTPSYCTMSAPSFGSLSAAGAVTAGQVYCAYGTSAHLNDPATWNGVIDLSASTTTKTGISDSFIGGDVVITTQGSVTLNAALKTALGSLLIYAGQTLVPVASVTTQGSSGISGDIFAPNGEIVASNGGTGGFTSFLEGNQVVVDASGGMTGDGPQMGSAGSSPLPGADSLTQ